MGAVIKRKTFVAADTVELARGLLGKTLVRFRPEVGVSRHTIVETEAYHGETDLACHASKGRTARTDVMYRAGGIWYVYLCYGCHEMLNLVVGPEGFPAAILLRGLHDVTGPGRLTRALAIDRSLNGSLVEPTSGLWIEDEGVHIPPSEIDVTPRIGVESAGPVWAAKPWRFVWRRPCTLQNGQTRGTINNASAKQSALSGNPTRTKSPKR
jgi:DNA-3-methyladenine glycosylase